VTVPVRVEIDGCQGHAQCARYSPDVFAIDDDGYATATSEPLVGDLADQARDAAAGCPERAIKVIELVEH
jgi:ferredoxin